MLIQKLSVMNFLNRQKNIAIARGRIANAVGRELAEVIFTSRVTEANNLVIKRE